MNANLFDKELKYITDINLRNKVVEVLSKIDNRYETLPASSSGKYHPDFDNTVGGLVNHSKAVFWVAYDLMCTGEYTEEEKNKVYASCILHDMAKYGKGSELTTHTTFTHPILMAEVLNENGLGEIAPLVEAHMGKWTTSKYNPGVELRRPQSKLEMIVHLADYMSARKYINESVYTDRE